MAMTGWFGGNHRIQLARLGETTPPKRFTGRMGFSRRYRDRVEAKPREGLVTGAVAVTCGLLVAVGNLWPALAWDMGSWLCVRWFMLLL